MHDVDSIAQKMQSNGYCEKSSYRWVSHVLASLVEPSILEKVWEIAESQDKQ
jgi:hypothetical protein